VGAQSLGGTSYASFYLQILRMSQFCILVPMSQTNPYQSPVTTSQDHSRIFGSLPVESPTVTAWLIFRSHFWALLICYLIVWVPTNLLVGYVDFHFIGPDDFGASFRLERAATYLIGILADGAIIAAVVCIYDRRSFGIGEMMIAGLVRWPKMWTTRFCVMIITFLGICLFVLPGVYFWVRTIYTDVIAVTENAHGPTAIRRSFDLTRGRFAEHLGKMLMICGAYVGLTVAIFVPMVVVYLWLEESEWFWLFNAVASLVYGPVVIFVHVYLYCWCRQLDDEQQQVG